LPPNPVVFLVVKTGASGREVVDMGEVILAGLIDISSGD